MAEMDSLDETVLPVLMEHRAPQRMQEDSSALGMERMGRMDSMAQVGEGEGVEAALRRFSGVTFVREGQALAAVGAAKVAKAVKAAKAAAAAAAPSAFISGIMAQMGFLWMS